MKKNFIIIKNFLWRQALKYIVNPKKVVNVHGNKMFLDSKDSLLLSIRKNYEPKHVNLIKKIVVNGDYVVDIGANIGYYTLLLSRLVGPNGKVFAFEPDPENFKILEKNVRINNCKNIVLEQKAISNKNGRIKLFLSPINKGDTRIYQTLHDKEKENKSKYEVDSVELDEYFKKNLSKISFFKMDIQGAEPLALEGMKKLLENKRLKFTIEFSPECLEAAGRSPLNFLAFLKDKGFSLYDLDKSENVVNNKKLVDYYKKINYFTTLYCFRK